MRTKIYLSPSSQNNNRYAYENYTESEVCRLISDSLYKLLSENKDFEVKQNLVDDMYVRVKESNNWESDLHLCIHTNAFNNNVGGTRVLVSEYDYKKIKNLVDNVLNKLGKISPGKSDNVNYNNSFYEILEAKAPTLYLEVEFHDVLEYAKWIVNNIDNIANIIYECLCNFYSASKEDKLFKIQLGAFKNKENAEVFLKEVKKVYKDAFIKEENI